jgi:DNA polymerase
MSRYLFMDFETKSDVDIGKCGAFRYFESEEFAPLLLAYGFDREPLTLVDFARGETWPEEFLAALDDPNVTLVAHNNAFERGVIEHELHYSPDERWIDTMHLFSQCGLPLSLDGACRAMGMDEDQGKMREGKALIRYFCVPCRPTKVNGGRTWNLPEHAPEKWETFCRYCLQDVEAMRTGFYRLEKWMPRPEELAFHALDSRINERGVRIDRRLAVMAVSMDEKNKQELTEKAIALTGMENPNSTAQVKEWLLDQEGKEFPSLNKRVIADVIASLETDKAREFMDIRTELSKSSVKKYTAMLRSMCADDHVRGCFAFYGASRTGRFAGRLVQFQNLSKNYMEDLDACRGLVRDGHYTTVKALYDGVADVLSQLVRTAIIPEDGHKILVSDFSAIEARVIAWIAGEEWRLKVFEEGGDIYCASASQMFKVPVVKHGVNGHLRQKGKVAELALGYGGGINALKAFGADKMGMTDEEMQETVDLWRESSPKICALWKSLERAAIKATVRGGTATDTLAGIRFDFENGILWMTLPSGRRIAYWGAKYEESKHHPDRKSLTYWGQDQQTKKWVRLETWGGKLTENLVQATARDCLRDAMFALDAAGFDIRAHVHDEVIVTEPIDGRSVDEMSEIMGRPLPWAPGLPLRADGYEGAYYFKD